jgi:hypothetical protein
MRAAIEGTSISLALIKRFARWSAPSVEYRTTRRYDGLFVVRRTEYFGFELDRDREPLTGAFPPKLADGARAALTAALVAGQTNHPDQGRVRRALDHLGEYWRRSAGTLKEVDPDTTHRRLAERLAGVKSLDQFHETRLRLDVADLVPGDAREALDALPKSAMVLGDRVPLDYEIENQEGIVRMRLREGQARRLGRKDLPEVDRPLHFTVVRGKQAAVRAANLDELQQVLASLPRRTDRPKLHRKHRRGRRRH